MVGNLLGPPSSSSVSRALAPCGTEAQEIVSPIAPGTPFAASPVTIQPDIIHHVPETGYADEVMLERESS